MSKSNVKLFIDMAKPIVYIDNVGRTMFAELVGKTETTLTVKNAAYAQVQPNQGNLQVQLIPLFFGELLSEQSRKDTGTQFTYALSNITVAGFELDERLEAQYNQVFNPVAVSAPPAGDTPIVKLFDND